MTIDEQIAVMRDCEEQGDHKLLRHILEKFEWVKLDAEEVERLRPFPELLVTCEGKTFISKVLADSIEGYGWEWFSKHESKFKDHLKMHGLDQGLHSLRGYYQFIMGEVTLGGG